jgi:PAS domain S-box-containing protein
MENTAPSEPAGPLILVVDDDEDTRLNLSDILELQGFRVNTAAAARELFARSAWDDVSLVLLDRKLPDSTPAEIIRRLNKVAPDAAIIIVTGHADIEGAITALRGGAADYILKPVNPAALVASVRRVLQRQHDTREIARLNHVLASSEEQYRRLFESTLDGLVVIDNDERLVATNPAACSILGGEARALHGRSLAELKLMINGTPHAARASDFFSAEHNSGECRLLRDDGAVMDLEYRTVASFTPGRHLVSLRDITDRKRAEERARQAERLAAIGETMAALVHESRNALQRSKACLEMLALEVENSPEALKLVARVERAQEDLHRLFEEVRQWAAPLNLRREECDLREVWIETWHHVLQTQPSRKVRLKEDLQCGTRCSIDRFAMSQVFRNIFENAVEASPAEGVIELRCWERPHGASRELVVSVTDQGPGLSPEQQRRIFEPFFTTKAKGTGLGMAIASRVIHSHSGTIAARSPRGTEIELVLPK